MSHTLEELKEAMGQTLDETTLLDVLGITSQDILDRFEDKIDERFNRLCSDLFEGEEDSDTETDL